MMDALVISRDLQSFSNRGVEVLPQIARATPVTLSLVLGAAVLWVVMSIAIGVAAAVLRGRIWDPLLMALGLIGMSIPVFWLGTVANLFTQDRWHDTFLFSWVPPLGYTPLTEDPVLWFQHLVIPWITLSILYIGFYSRVLRSALIEAEGQDFVRTARAKGISRAARARPPLAADLDDRLREPVRARPRRADRAAARCSPRSSSGCPASAG